MTYMILFRTMSGESVGNAPNGHAWTREFSMPAWPVTHVAAVIWRKAQS